MDVKHHVYLLTSYVCDIFETLLIDKLIALIALVAFTLSLIFLISFGDLANFRVTCTLSLKIRHRTFAFILRRSNVRVMYQ